MGANLEDTPDLPLFRRQVLFDNSSCHEPDVDVILITDRPSA